MSRYLEKTLYYLSHHIHVHMVLLTWPSRKKVKNRSIESCILFMYWVKENFSVLTSSLLCGNTAKLNFPGSLCSPLGSLRLSSGQRNVGRSVKCHSGLRPL